MASAILERELHQQLEDLPFTQQRQVLDFAHELALAHSRGVAGQRLLQFAGTIELDDLELISRAIEEDCEKVDAREW